MRRKSDAREVTSRCWKPWGKGLMEQHWKLDLCETGRCTSWNRSILVQKVAIWRRPTNVKLWERSSCYNDYKIIRMSWSTTILSWRKNVYILSWSMQKRATFMATLGRLKIRVKPYPRIWYGLLPSKYVWVLATFTARRQCIEISSAWTFYWPRMMLWKLVISGLPK